jgi:hypothetical protein
MQLSKEGATKIYHASIGMMFLGGLFALGAIGNIIWQYVLHSKASASKNWSRVEGTVIKSRVEEKKRTSSSGGGSSGPRGHGSSSSSTSVYYTYRPVVSYSYVVDGKNYDNDRINFRQDDEYKHRRGKRHAQKIVSRYPEGSKITVYYDPEDPQEAVLVSGDTETHTEEMVVQAILASVLLLVFGVGVWLYVMSKKQGADTTWDG